MSKIRRNNFCSNCKNLDQKYDFCDLHKFRVGTYDSQRYRCDSHVSLEEHEVRTPPGDYREANSCDNCMHCEPSRTTSCYTLVCSLHERNFSEYDKLRNFVCDDWDN